MWRASGRWILNTAKANYIEADASLVDANMRDMRIVPLAILVPHVRALSLLAERGQKDPFDRIIAAQAIVENLPLVTADPAFGDYHHLDVRW